MYKKGWDSQLEFQPFVLDTRLGWTYFCLLSLAFCAIAGFEEVSSVAVPADFFSLLSVFFARFFSACFLPLLPFGSSLLATVFLPPDFTDGEGFETTLPTDLSSEDAEATTDCGPFVFTVFFFSAPGLALETDFASGA